MSLFNCWSHFRYVLFRLILYESMKRNVEYKSGSVIQIYFRHSQKNIGIRDAKSPAYAKHSLSRIVVNKTKKVKRNIFLTTMSLQRNSHVFLTSFSQWFSHTVALTISSTSVVLTTSQYTRNLSVVYKCP